MKMDWKAVELSTAFFCCSTDSLQFCPRMKAKKIIITIDGWSSCGKSTLARQLAKSLGYIYVDSGAMYRAITLYFLRNHVDWTDIKEVKKALKEINLEFIYNPKSQSSEIYLNEENVEYVIRDLVIAEKVSEIAAIKEVRDFAVAQQQLMGKNKGIVMDGRDIGTVVFPDAELKIFMTADNAIRVERRFKELYDKNPNITLDEVRANLELRDYIDSHREVSPLHKAEDAIELDNTNLTEEEQFKKALKLVKDLQHD
ncbi:MAG TPA: (d)CMP kinase [Chitinophagaceae bacterium]